uniref:TRAF3-interacting protein 1 C-terminal domain-containing protein n=1 Tax=Plectus sambesii TaxID=2011161 RepID=A0A914VF09_9BILA
EDIDSMLKELEQWKSEYRGNTAKLRETYGNADSDIEPLRMRLSDLDNQIKETRDAISSTRANVIANEEKLRNLINSVGR